MQEGALRIKLQALVVPLPEMCGYVQFWCANAQPFLCNKMGLFRYSQTKLGNFTKQLGPFSGDSKRCQASFGNFWRFQGCKKPAGKKEL